MLVLGIETSTPQVSVAVGSEEGILASCLLGRGRSHVEFVAPAISFALSRAGVELRRLAGVAVSTGPGLFTGLRVGVAAARALAQALDLPLIGIPSLDLLAYRVRFASRLVCAAIDAKRGEVYAGLYRPVPGGMQRVGEFRLWSPASLAAELDATGEDVLLVGDGFLVHRRAFLGLERAEWVSPAMSFPSAEVLVELAVPRLHREEYSSPFEVRPIYLRKSDAEIAWEKARR